MKRAEPFRPMRQASPYEVWVSSSRSITGVRGHVAGFLAHVEQGPEALLETVAKLRDKTGICTRLEVPAVQGNEPLPRRAVDRHGHDISVADNSNVGEMQSGFRKPQRELACRCFLVELWTAVEVVVLGKG